MPTLDVCRHCGTQNSKIRYAIELLRTIDGGVQVDEETNEVIGINWSLLPEGTLKKVGSGKDFFLSQEERKGVAGWPESLAKKVRDKQQEPPEEWLASYQWVQSQAGEEAKVAKDMSTSKSQQ